MRHLLYHLLPHADQWGVWRWNLAILRSYLPLFDGRKIVSVVTSCPDGRWPLAPLHEVRYELPDCELIEATNDVLRYEGVSWPGLWAALGPDLKGDDFVFLAHAKGVTRPPHQHQATGLWTATMAEVCLSDWSRVEPALRTHDLAGAFKMRCSHPLNRSSDWHFPGTFFWTAARALAGGVPDPTPGTHGVEGWPGQHFAYDRGACLFMEVGYNPHQLYDENWHRHVVQPALARWRAKGRVS